MLYVGTSGWQYRHWIGVFYPEKLAQGRWLEHYAQRFQTVEVNNTFYNLPPGPVFERWRRRVPDDFVFALKLSRFLTHLKRLRDPADPVHRFMERAKALGPKLGPILVQLPPRFERDLGALDQALATFDRSVRVAVEFRDDSWFTQETRDVLARHGAALCLADSPRRTQPHWRTASWGFVRFHEGRGQDAPGYDREALATWVRRIAELWASGEDVYVYFNNDPGGHAVRDAVTFAELAARAGLSPTRVPSADAA